MMVKDRKEKSQKNFRKEKCRKKRNRYATGSTHSFYQQNDNRRGYGC